MFGKWRRKRQVKRKRLIQKALRSLGKGNVLQAVRRLQLVPEREGI